MILERKFSQLRKEQAAWQRDTSFVAQLFSFPEWSASVDTSCPETTSCLGERREAIEGMYNFVRERADQNTGVLSVPGGELMVKASCEQEYFDADFASSLEQMPATNCQNCPFSQQSTGAKIQTESSISSPKVLFLGDYPRSEGCCFPEDKDQLLNRMIQAMGLSKGEYVKSLAVKCSVEGDREVMIASCFFNLMREIAFLRPKVVIPMGALATRAVLGKQEKLSKVHGQFFAKKIKFSDQQEFSYQILPIFHPEFLLINPQMKRTTWNDLQKVMAYLAESENNS